MKKFSVTPKNTVTINRNEYDINDYGMTFEKGEQYDCEYLGGRRYCVYLGAAYLYFSQDRFHELFQ